MTGAWGENEPLGPVDQPYAGPPSTPAGAQPPPIPTYVPPPPGGWGGVEDRQPFAPAPAPAPATPQVRYADWGERVGATLVDWALIFAPFFVVAVVAPGSDLLEDLAGLVWLAGSGWVAWLNGSKGQSPGKALMGLKLVRETDGSTLGGPVGLARAVVLSLMAVFSGGIAWVLSLLWPLWNPKHRALHDMIFSASVVAGQPRAKLGKGIFLP